MNKFLAAILFFPLSFLIIIYRAKLKDITGSVGFAEKYFGPGGTYTLYLLIGVILFIGTLMYITGTLESLLSSTVGRLF